MAIGNKDNESVWLDSSSCASAKANGILDGLNETSKTNNSAQKRL